jgi:hypothetical protein
MQAVVPATRDLEAENDGRGAGALADEAVQEKLEEYQKRVATEGELSEADLAELESMAPDPDKEEQVWQVRLRLLRHCTLIVPAGSQLVRFTNSSI